MFLITTTKAIKISRGDDSGRFPLFLNKGTTTVPIRYELTPDITGTTSSKVLTEIAIDKDKWRSVVVEDGLYSFYYRHSQWYLKGKIVWPSDYGISYVGTPENEDTINVLYNMNAVEIYFYICENNSSLERYLVKKTFKQNGEVVTQYRNKPNRKYKDSEIMNEDGDLMLRIDSEDTRDFLPGEYTYCVQAKVVDFDTHSYCINTVTNKLPFYVIDDDYDRSW